MIIEEIEWRAPLDAFAALEGEPHAHLLHAGSHAEEAAWSFITAFPAAVIEARGETALRDGVKTSRAPFDELAALYAERSIAEAVGAFRWPGDAPPPYLSGLAGFVGYEAGGLLEPTAKGPPSPYSLPDFAFGAYDAIAVFDHRNGRAFVVSRNDGAGAALSAALRGSSNECGEASAHAFRDLRSSFSSAAYRAAVAQIIERIRDGEFFQANIAQTLTAAAEGKVAPISLFRVISGESSAAFGALLQYADGVILSNSPERFFRIEMKDGVSHIMTDPIKGTRPRGKTPEEDGALGQALLADPKDRAENVMIADLMRNDLSRICRDHTVNEDFICKLVSHAAVHHMVSRISGDLRAGLSPVDALRALFPCGSITGAPKVQAMKAIGETEGTGRGPYCGAIGYIDDRGGAEFSVAIRTAVLTQGGESAEISIPVGGGVTIRSNPEEEYHETLVKAKTILSALALDAGEVFDSEGAH